MINMKNVDKFVRLGTFEDLWFIMILSNIHFMGDFILNLLPELSHIYKAGCLYVIACSCWLANRTSNVDVDAQTFLLY